MERGQGLLQAPPLALGRFERAATRCQASTRRWKRAAMSAIAASSVISPLSQRRAASLKIVRPTAKPFTSGSLGGGREGGFQFVLRRLEPEQHDAAAIGIVRS